MKNEIKIILGFLAVIIIVTIAATFPGKTETYDENLLKIDYTNKGNTTDLKYETDNPVVALYVEKYGSIVIELYPDIAPNTVNNFITLVKEGFYDNNTFHRLIPGFVLQGGDPTGTGTGGPGYTIKGEFTDNGFENNLSHTSGIVSMARSADNDSAGSQFFICLGTNTHLDNKYAAFGNVIDGNDNIEKIVKKEEISDASSGKLKTNLTIKKAVVDLNNYELKEVEKIQGE